jgi:hypothetical protein
MGAVKRWLMTMEEAAESAISDGLCEKDALKYMSTVMSAAGQPAAATTLKQIYNNVNGPSTAVNS